MLPAALGALTRARRCRNSSCASQLQQLRNLNIHEYQGAQLMSQFGINVPPGVPVTKIGDVLPAAKKMANKDNEVVVKSQILAGGRGLGTFKNGFKGGVHIVKVDKAEETAKKMLGEVLVTKQTGPAGKPVGTLFIASRMNLAKEMYFAILTDRASAEVLMIGCGEGGTSIEELAEKFPEKIVKVPVDVRKGVTDAQAQQMVDGLGVDGDKADAVKQIKGLYDLFTQKDCTMVEVNPLAMTTDGKLIAADAKIGFDDNASFRQKDLFSQRDTSQEDPREVEAGKYNLNYIGLDGNIGCMVNGAGLAMATMDIIKLHGGSPANFLDVGGAADEDQILAALNILTSDKQVKAILVNIFGGIMKCDVIAQGIVNAAKKAAIQVPLVVRLEGTNVERGKAILDESDVSVITANDLDDAAEKAVEALHGANVA